MTLLEHVQNEHLNTPLPGVDNTERIVAVSNWCVIRLMKDGSALIYKNFLGTVYSLGISRHDMEAIQALSLPVPLFTPGPESDKDVHTEHCCFTHGCKYADPYCPVSTGEKFQSFACETCQAQSSTEDDFCGWRNAEPTPTVLQITRILETCSGCPTQWTACTDNGKCVLVRYRHGILRVDVDYVTIFEDSTNSGSDGVLTFEEMKTRTNRILNFDNVRWIEKESDLWLD